MPNIKDTSKVAAKWARVTPQRTEDYDDGISNPAADWATNTKAAEARWKDGVTKAASRNAFGKGVSGAGSEKWQRRSKEIGTRRWGEGVQVAKSDYEAGFKPYADTISSTTLPPRYPKGDPRNLDRVKAIATALRAKKESIA
jgi:hypothetical protein